MAAILLLTFSFPECPDKLSSSFDITKRQASPTAN